MAMDFTKTLVRDNVLNVSDSIKYGVKKGGQNVTPAIYNALSESAGSQTYNIQVPSEQTIIDREVLWSSTIEFDVTYNFPASTAGGSKVINPGSSDALAPFPLHSCASVMTATINNNSVSMNTQDVLPFLLHMVKRKNLHRYAGMTPTALDSYAKYDSDANSNNNALGAFQNSVDNDWSPRGSWVLDYCTTDTTATIADGNFNIATSVTGAQTVVVRCKARVTEPLLLSPFIFGHPYSNNQGFYGIQNMNFVFNMNNGNRLWRSNSTASSVSCQIKNFYKSELRFMFYTPHPSMLMPSRNVVGYYEVPRYITTYGESVPAGAHFNAQTNNLQLNQIPDKLIIAVRKKLSTQTPQDPDYWMTIKDLNIQFNNLSGILSTANKQQLYKMSIESGSNQSWNEFNGKANIVQSSPLLSQNTVGTSGSMLVLDFAKDIQLTEDFYAPGSLGNFNLQIGMNCVNNTPYDFPEKGLEVVLITLNSGLFVCERGTSSVYTGILTKQDVLDASSQAHYSKSDVDRMVGGGFLDNLSSMAGYVKGLPSVVEKVKDTLEDPCTNKKKMSGSGKKSMTDNRFY
jgi:hypothetical protein